MISDSGKFAVPTTMVSGSNAPGAAVGSALAQPDSVTAATTAQTGLRRDI